MLRTSEGETEILLGNSQLIGIFFVVAALLGVAFYGGYMVGRAGTAKKTIASATTAPTAEQPAAAPATGTGTAGGETHSFPADSTPPADQTRPPADTSSPADQPPLGAPKRKSTEAEQRAQTEAAPPADTSAEFTPQPGQQFLQVAAVGRDEAEAVADVLHKKGFRAHAVPKPGNAKLYRVLIGPLDDAADLSSTRDALRRTGFREVIVQRY
ncbi:MAG: SPOR domain-containing protein [Acidobacteriaceae bacterium]|nr:SPOR domain-containing protein [Acidobacteriaceae bacterium]